MLKFEPVPQSVPAARNFVLASAVVDDEDIHQVLATLTSELATNAVLHARTSFSVTVQPAGSSVRVTVRDQSPELPAPKNHDRLSATGRGLHIIDALADRWGFEPLPDGKAVWFEVDFRREGAR